MESIKAIRSKVGLNCSTMVEVFPINYSAYVIAELIKYYKGARSFDDEAIFPELIEIVISVRKRTRKHSFSKNAIISLIKTEFLMDKSLDELRVIIKDTLFCSFPTSNNDVMLFKSISSNPPSLRTDYGEEEYIPNATLPTQSRTQIKKSCNVDEINKYEKPVIHETHKERLSDTSSDSLYARLLLKDDSRKSAKHTWQWLLSNEEYLIIKKYICSHDIPSPKKLQSSYSHILRLYIGEFYKREWDGTNNPFCILTDSNNSDFGNYQLLCEKNKLCAYKKINNTYQQTLYVDGGLPIHFILSRLSSNNKSLFIESLSFLLDDDDCAMIDGESLLEKSTSSTALRESFHQGCGHSIYDYICAIRTKNQTWNESDNASSEFSEFIGKVKEARERQEKRRKFSLRYTLGAYHNDESVFEFILSPILRFNPEDNTGKRHFGITSNKLSEWGIKTNATQFELRIGDEHVLFSWCVSGDYISLGLVTQIDFPQLEGDDISIDTLSAPSVSVFCSDTGQEYALPTDCVISPIKRGFIQFYTDDDPSMGAWTSYKGNRAFNWSSVLYDKERFIIESPLQVFDINAKFGWIIFDNKVSFYDKNNGKNIDVYNRKDNIYAMVADTCLHPIVNNPLILPEGIQNGCVKIEIDGNSKHVPIIRPRHIEFNVYNSETDQMVQNDGFFVQYKHISSESDTKAIWEEFADNLVLNQGLYAFLLTNKSLSTVQYCYVLSDDASITTHIASTPYKIIFKNINNVVCDNLRSKPLENGRAFLIEKNNNQDSYRFTIDMLTIETYHPRPQTHVLAYGKNPKSLLIALADDIRISYISSTGCDSFYLSEKSRIYKRLFDALTFSALDRTNGMLIQPIPLHTIVPDIDSSDYKIRIYTQEIDNNNETENLYLLNFSNNTIIPISSCQPIFSAKCMALNHFDALLFQSLKGIGLTESYFMPKFISKYSTQQTDKKTARVQRLDDYVEKEYWNKSYTFEQFDIAHEHKLYFAVFDSLISILWDKRNHCFYSTTRTIVKKRFASFLSYYVKYCGTAYKTANCTGLLRLSRELQFDWQCLDTFTNTFDENTLSIYKKITK